jgi:hypothetical protein
VELLTVLSIVTLLVALIVPALAQVQRVARGLINVRNQRDIVTAVTLFACDHDQQFPSSVALCGDDKRSWSWQDPRKMRTTKPCAWMEHSSVAGYLNAYLSEAERWSCPSVPEPHPYWQQAWEAADTWDHPRFAGQDALYGSYCLYWNYVGYQDNGPFRGPTSLYGGPRESTLLVSDYFGYNESCNPKRYGSCEWAGDARIIASGSLSTSYWSYEASTPSPAGITITLRLNAGYTDGHVERYRPAQTDVMQVSEATDGSEPSFPNNASFPGYFFVPRSSSP